MSLHRGIDGAEPLNPGKLGGAAGPREERRDERSTRLAMGTLACPGCDAPVSPVGRRMRAAEPLICPYCGHGGPVRDFLSLAAPARPAVVAVNVVPRRR